MEDEQVVGGCQFPIFEGTIGVKAQTEHDATPRRMIDGFIIYHLKGLLIRTFRLVDVRKDWWLVRVQA